MEDSIAFAIIICSGLAFTIVATVIACVLACVPGLYDRLANRFHGVR